jgi:hypothetical protein
MNLISIIFNLARTYLPFWEEKDLTRTQAQAIGWHDSIRFDDDIPKSERTWKWYYRFYSEQWGAKVCFAVVYIWAIRAIGDFISPKRKKSEEDED